MSFVIIAILLALALLIVAGPVLEELIDRIRPPGTARRRKGPASHH
ncbi:MAG: hypothetical protein SYR96_24390 [Actinomycetota bacterium]|nr:hypothetical protein [Actinomycetota bacterium]